MHLPQHTLYTRKTELPLEMKWSYLDFHQVYMAMQRTQTNWSDVKYTFPAVSLQPGSPTSKRRQDLGTRPELAYRGIHSQSLSCWLCASPSKARRPRSRSGHSWRRSWVCCSSPIASSCEEATWNPTGKRSQPWARPAGHPGCSCFLSPGIAAASPAGGCSKCVAATWRPTWSWCQHSRVASKTAKTTHLG